MPWPRLTPGQLDPESSALTIRPPRHPQCGVSKVRRGWHHIGWPTALKRTSAVEASWRWIARYHAKITNFTEKVKIELNKNNKVNRNKRLIYQFQISCVCHLGFYGVTALSLLLKADLLFEAIGKHSGVMKSKMVAWGKFKSDIFSLNHVPSIGLDISTHPLACECLKCRATANHRSLTRLTARHSILPRKISKHKLTNFISQSFIIMQNCLIIWRCTQQFGFVKRQIWLPPSDNYIAHVVVQSDT